MLFTLSSPVRVLVGGFPEDTIDLELPDVLTVGVVRSIRANPKTEMFDFVSQLLVKTKALGASAAGQVTGADATRVLQYFSEKLEPVETDVRAPDPSAFVLARLKLIKADAQSDSIEWGAQVLQHVGQMAVDKVNQMPVGELVTLLESMVENTFLPKTGSAVAQ